MKKALLSLFAIASVTSMCFAETASAPSGADNSANSTQASSNATATAQVPNVTVAPTQVPASTTPAAPARTTTFTGNVYSVSSGQIIVKDNDGQGTTFMVASDATIIGKDGNSTTLNWINTDDKVNIEYITNQDGTKTAKSIKVSVGW